MKKGGRPRIRKKGQQWRRLSIALLPEEADEWEKLRGTRTQSMFLKLLLQVYKMRLMKISDAS